MLNKIAPFKSEKQRRYLWMHHPEIAEKWTKEHGSKIVPSKKKKKKKAEYMAGIIKIANIEEMLAKKIKDEHPDWTFDEICEEIDRLGEEFAKSKEYKKASVSKISSREFVHCPVCGKESNVVGTHGYSKKYACGTCDYRFSNK